MKKIITILICLAVISTSTVVANASLFYDISGNTDISYKTTGVLIAAQSETTEGVDSLFVGTGIYVDDVYMGKIEDTVDDTNFAFVSTSRSYYGYIYATSFHKAFDWTGDEWTSSDCAFIR